MRDALVFWAILTCLFAADIPSDGDTGPVATSHYLPPQTISLRETARERALYDLQRGPVLISGTVSVEKSAQVLVRVTTSLGSCVQREFAAVNGHFMCRYPIDFSCAPSLKPGMLFIDATPETGFNKYNSAEIGIIVYDGKNHVLPDLPAWVTSDLRDKAGRTDQNSSKWLTFRTLANLYMRSRAARIVGVGTPGFDVANKADLEYFKDNISWYDFSGRDRDWSTPLNNRTARTFWQSVWRTWYNPTNDHPLDGNPKNLAVLNYMPYAFSNDYSDILIMYLMRLAGKAPCEDNILQMNREAVQNLLAMQHTGEDNFALPDTRGHRETYTAGAFHYGMFDDGSYLTEGKGWFYNPEFRDYANGGVLNGRATWALGEAIKADPKGPLAAKIKSAIALSVKFCLGDALKYGYAHTTKKGNVFWRDAGEHAYLTLGLLAACSVDPNMQVPDPSGKPQTIRAVCISSLNALVELQKANYQWAVYPNVDSMCIAALADGVELLGECPDSTAWKKAATGAADAWMNAAFDPKEYPAKPVHFGLRISDKEMTYKWSRLNGSGWAPHNFIFFYQSGHWIHALSRLYSVTSDTRYKDRAESIVSYLLGDNPWGVRLLNELGGLYNWVEDTDNDGIEDKLKQDMYPESTCFTQIGIYHLLNAVVAEK
ncbi:MAG: hypothetical protein ABFD54_03825 [Armatimonadota bacterium]|nr:hypothetical protein [bacterium]